MSQLFHLTQRVTGKLLATTLPWWSLLNQYRIAYDDPSTDPSRPEYRQHHVFTFWHEYLGVLISKWAGAPLSLLVSQHRDAEWLGQIATSLGYQLARGSSTRGGADAIRRLKTLSEHSSLVITPDGPVGPRRQMALGPVFLASTLQLPLVPVGIGIDRPARLKTWDRFAIPLPFRRIRIVMGKRIDIPKGIKKHELEEFRQLAQDQMDQLNETADSWATRQIELEGHKIRRYRKRSPRTKNRTPPLARANVGCGAAE